MTSRKILIVGGGLAGLSAAYRLRGAAEIVLLEAEARCGGQILTDRRDGFTIERGAEGFVFRGTAVPELAARLGMPADALIGQTTLRSYGYDGASLVALAPGEAATYLGFQVSREDLGKGIRSLQDGMGSLTAALEAALGHAPGVVLRRGARVRSIECGSGGVRVALDSGAADEADAVLIATNAIGAARLLSSLTSWAAPLSSAPTLSSITVELAFERSAVEHALDATGFVVAEAAQHEGLRACTFTTSKFGGRAPDGQVSLRLFFRPTTEDLTDLDDSNWTQRALRGLRRVIAVRDEPLRAWVSRWPNALPVFSDAHRASVAALERELHGAHLPIVLAGSAFHGSGIDAAVQSGERAAAQLRAMLAAAG